MKSQKLKELRAKDDEALKELEAQHRRKLFDYRTQALMEELKSASDIQKTRREIARIHTIRRERELAANKSD